MTTTPRRGGETNATDHMTAVHQERYGSPDTLTLADVAIPAIAADEVLIEVHAAGVDRGVWHLVTGLPYLVRLTGFGVRRPKNPTPGLDVAGRVVAVGTEVQRFGVGDDVFGIARGAYAEYAAAQETKLAHRPEQVSHSEAAAVAISGSTALQALTKVGRVQAGQRVLVLGASGGVGSYAVQLAALLGARVTGVSSTAKTDLVRSLGAEEALSYESGDHLDGSGRFDLVIDTGGRTSLRRLRRELVPGGTLVIVGGEGGNRWTGGFGRQIRALLLSPFVSQRLTAVINEEHHRWIDQLAVHLADGSLVAAVGTRYRLDQTPEAIADLAAGKATGKSVIVVRDDSDDRRP